METRTLKPVVNVLIFCLFAVLAPLKLNAGPGLFVFRERKVAHLVLPYVIRPDGYKVLISPQNVVRNYFPCD